MYQFIVFNVILYIFVHIQALDIGQLSTIVAISLPVFNIDVVGQRRCFHATALVHNV
jgi:hypothetical protein